MSTVYARLDEGGRVDVQGYGGVSWSSVSVTFGSMVWTCRDVRVECTLTRVRVWVKDELIMEERL